MSRKRERSRHAGGLVVAHLAAVLLVILLGFWWATQWVAHMLAFQAQLGPPWFRLLSYPVYQPWQYLVWVFYFNAYAPEVFTKAMMPIFGGACLSVVTAFAMSIWRARLVDTATTHGSARWASRREVAQSCLVAGNQGVVLGIAEDGRYLTHDGPEHVIVIAPSRSGKGVGIVVPTMLNWTHSVVCNDIKREVWEETAGWRSTFSHVMAFDPSSFATARFNPLFEVRKGAFEVKDVQNITDMMVDPDGKGKPDHWTKEGDAYLVAVILHVLYAEEDKTLAGVACFLNHPTRSLEETLGVMRLTCHLGDRVHPVVAMGARAMLNKSTNERSGVHSTAKSFLALYHDPIVANATRSSDFAIADLMKAADPVSLYLIAPPSDKKRLRPLFRLVLNQICTRLTEQLNPVDNRHRLLLLLDEFPSLGKIDFFEESLGFVAGYGMKAVMISQSYNQIVKYYGPTNTIVDAAHVRVYFAPNTEDSGERISKALGTTTEIHQQKNYGGHRLAPWLGHVMLADQESARPLMTPGEIMELPAGDEIVMVAGMPPVYARKIVYHADRNFRDRMQHACPAPLIPNDGPYPFACPPHDNPWCGLPLPSSGGNTALVDPASAASAATATVARGPDVACGKSSLGADAVSNVGNDEVNAERTLDADRHVSDDRPLEKADDRFALSREGSNDVSL